MKYCPRCNREYADDYDASVLDMRFTKGQCSNMSCVMDDKNRSPFELPRFVSPGLLHKPSEDTA